MKPIQEFTLFLQRERIDEVLIYVNANLRSLIDSHLSPIKREKRHFNGVTKNTLTLLFETLKKENPPLVPSTVYSVLAEAESLQLQSDDVEPITQVFKSAFISQVPFFTADPVETLRIHKEIDKAFAPAYALTQNAGENQKPGTGLQSEEVYKDFFDHAHDLMHIVHPDGTLLYVNDAWQRALGYSLKEIQGHSVFSFVDTRDIDLYKEHRNRVLKGINRNQRISIRLKTKWSKTITIEGAISVKEKDGVPLYTSGVFIDITAKVERELELKNIYGQLKEREENLRQLVTNAPDAIIVIDAASIISYWNPKAEAVFGWKAEEVEGKQLSEIIIPQIYREAHHKGMNRFLTTGEASVLNKTIDVTAIRKDGEEINISLTVSNAKQGGHEIFISFIRDITQEKKNELELVRKKRELEESNRELEQYSWLTSHDLREPLRKVLTFSDILMRQHNEQLSPQVEKYIHKIRDSSKRMSSLIQAVLSYSEATQKQTLYEETDLNKIIKEVQGDLELMIQDSNANIETEEMPVLHAIPFQMYQLFQNLLSNAIKYRRPDIIPHIHISSGQLDGMVHIFIKDNGHGFSTPDKEKIFHLFQRLESPSKVEGMGIGLAICKKIVEQHHGFIKVDSTLNVGTIFIIGLPIKQKVF